MSPAEAHLVEFWTTDFRVIRCILLKHKQKIYKTVQIVVQSCPNFKLLPINISCECSSFVWNNRGVNVGMCNSVDLDGRPLCYLHQPNNCRDAVDSQVIPGMQVIQVFQDFFVINRTQLFSCSVEPFETSCRSPR